MSRTLDHGKFTVIAPPSSLTPFKSATANYVSGWRGASLPVEVQLNTQYNGQTESSVVDWSFPMGAIASAPHCGYFKIEYGCGALVNTRYIDLSSGRFYLGVCDQVTINAFRWRGNDWPDYNNSPAIQVSGSIAAAGGGDYSEMTATMPQYVPATTVVDLSYQAPPGAKSYSIAVGLYNQALAYWGSAEPDIRFVASSPNDSGAREAFVVRPAQYTVVPPFRRGFTGGDIAADGLATVAATVVTVQYQLSS